MKKTTLLLALCACLCLTAACGAPPPQADPALPSGGEPAPISAPTEEAPVRLTCRIVDGAEDGVLLLAALDAPLHGEPDGLHDGRSVYRLSLTADIPVTLDGQPASAADLRDGMPVEVAFNGQVSETFPARPDQVRSVAGYSIGTPQCPGGTLYDLCGLYLQALDDLWRKDPALNEGITLAALDLTQAPGGLLDSEKAALAWRFGELHGVEVLDLTFEDLIEQGYLTASATGGPAPAAGEGSSGLWYSWEDGCLFSIRPNSGHEGEIYSLPTLFFDAEKWRTPLGAYCLYDCSAVWPEMGTWSGYTVGGEMIS